MTPVNHPVTPAMVKIAPPVNLETDSLKKMTSNVRQDKKLSDKPNQRAQ